MTAFINLLLYIGLAMVPFAIMLIIRHFATKKAGLDERYVPSDPNREPDYKQWDNRSR